MSKIWKYMAAVALLFIGLGAFAQDKTQAYYNAHESEILPNAQAAFRDGDYDRAAELCKWHYIIVGDNRADELRDKAERCAKLTLEMNTLLAAGQNDAVREKVRAVLALNPEDKNAKDVYASIPSTGVINGHEWVDLGLPSGLKWATCNLGASKPEASGSYFAWGETKPKSEYRWENYKFHESGSSAKESRLTKYGTGDKNGIVDNKTHLDPEDDAVRADWGGSWRMPTKEEQDELRAECIWTLTTQGGTKGYKVTSKVNGNSIFLPAVGYRFGTDSNTDEYYGAYWSSSLYSEPGYSSLAYELYLSSETVGWGYHRREDGLSVRPVSE